MDDEMKALLDALIETAKEYWDVFCCNLGIKAGKEYVDEDQIDVLINKIKKIVEPK